MDISSDSTLLATGSADKSIKLWGLDFGDCHKSLPAHSDSVTGVNFVFGTHYLFSISKDSSVKYWDCDTWESVQSVGSHGGGEVWGLAVGKFGNVVATAGAGRGIRVWEKSDDQVKNLGLKGFTFD